MNAHLPRWMDSPRSSSSTIRKKQNSSGSESLNVQSCVVEQNSNSERAGPIMMHHSNDISLIIRFEQVLSDQESRRLFHEFLKFHRTEEPLLFLNDLEEYQHEYEQLIFQSSSTRDSNRVRSSSLKITARKSVKLNRLSISSSLSVDSLSSSCSSKSSFNNSSSIFIDDGVHSHSVHVHNSPFLEVGSTSIDIPIPPTNFSPTLHTKRKSLKTHSKRLFKELTQIFDKLQKIIENYIRNGARHELNIGSHQLVVLDMFSTIYGNFSHLVNSSYEMHSIEHAVSTLLQQMDPEVLFAKLVQTVHQDLKSELFPRFVRSELFLNLVKEKGEEYFLRHATNSPCVSHDSIPPLLVLDASRSNSISKQVLTFGLRLAQEGLNHWKLIHEKVTKNDHVKMRLFTSERTTLPIMGMDESTTTMKRSMKFLKCDLEIPQSFENVVNAWISYLEHQEEVILRDYLRPTNIDGACQVGETPISDLDILSPSSPLLLPASDCSPFCIQKCDFHMDMHIPCVKKRTFPAVATSVGDGHTMSMFAFRSIACLDEHHSSLSFMPCLGFFIFYKLGEDMTRVCHLLAADFSLPFLNSDLLYESFWKARGSKLAKELSQQCDNPSQDSLRFKQTIRENAKTFSNSSSPPQWWYQMTSTTTFLDYK
ncbi:hypothetical protein FDP41_011731 [Naegleria fowleri]|uniref:RGS domain-containing protein n=1 Tax=Naegleria fowleri TaxID=5763 RepID=A0A6A5C7U9_NAEFO|nr:uncharacterized protein FDP41_011731 [Naegleria fowleri]KAF0981870.1 hypothetical protein FDP41_011731 [Naegleria fowleri]